MKAKATAVAAGCRSAPFRHSALQQDGPPVRTLPQREGWMQGIQASAAAAKKKQKPPGLWLPGKETEV